MEKQSCGTTMQETQKAQRKTLQRMTLVCVEEEDFSLPRGFDRFDEKIVYLCIVILQKFLLTRILNISSLLHNQRQNEIFIPQIQSYLATDPKLVRVFVRLLSLQISQLFSPSPNSPGRVSRISHFSPKEFCLFSGGLCQALPLSRHGTLFDSLTVCSGKTRSALAMGLRICEALCLENKGCSSLPVALQGTFHLFHSDLPGASSWKLTQWGSSEE